MEKTFRIPVPDELIPESMRHLPRPVMEFRQPGEVELRELYDRFRDGGTFEEFQEAVKECGRETELAICGDPGAHPAPSADRQG